MVRAGSGVGFRRDTRRARGRGGALTTRFSGYANGRKCDAHGHRVRMTIPFGGTTR